MTTRSGARARRRWLVGALVILALAAGCPFSEQRVAAAPSAPPAGASSAQEFELTAETIDHSLDSGLLTASGGVDLRLSGLEAKGGQLEADLKQHVARMVGPVTLITANGIITGENLLYAWDTGQGTLDKAATVAQKVIITGRQAEVTPGGVILRDGLFTKCDLAVPEYAFLTRQTQVDPQTDTVTAQGVTLALFGHRILPLPDLHFSLKDTQVGQMSRERLPVPAVGYDSDRGAFAYEQVLVYLSDRGILMAGAGLATTEGGRLTLSGLYTPTPATTYRLEARYREFAPTGSSSGTDKAPKVDGLLSAVTQTSLGRLTLGVERTQDDQRKDSTLQDLTFLPRVQLAPKDFRLAGLTVTPGLEWARIREEATGEETSRTLGTLDWSSARQTAGPWAWNLSGGLGLSAYGTGQTLKAGRLNATVERSLTSDWSLVTAFNYSQVAGATPFAFDLPDLFAEQDLGISWRKGADHASASVVYDLAAWGTGSATDPARGPAALKATLSADHGLWTADLDLRYDLGDDPHYETATLKLTRHLHCFDLSLSAEPLDHQVSLQLTLR